MESLIAPLLRDHLKISEKVLSTKKLHGDASCRTYWRVSLAGGRSFIVMQLPEGISSASEEITNLREKPEELPFVNIDRYLKKVGLPVPEIYHFEESKKILILEDLGDETLEKILAHTPPEEWEAWYRKAIDLLILFQNKSQSNVVTCIAHQRSFDENLLNWEFEHFLEYGIEARSGRKIDPDDRKTIRQGTNFITFALTRLPQTLVHRDFQSRNLMIHEGRLKLIDFQDALMGPLPYDLVALLRDSYVELPTDLLEALIRYYPVDDVPFFRKMFDWMTIQRKLKDAGRFVYIDRVKKNPSFLPYIPLSLRYVCEAFERQEELRNLFEVLKKYVPEFQK